MISRFHKVINGLYRGSAPSPKDVQLLKDKYNIKKIVSLDKEAGDRIHRTCKLLGITHVMAPIELKKSSLVNFLHHNLHDLLIKGGPTYVHCHWGKDRTGLVVAMFKCKYLKENPDKAIHEAKSFGFGVGIPIEVVHLYEKMIKACKPTKDENSADIVSESREPVGSINELEGHTSSFAPYLDQTRQYPADSVYNDINSQSPTRENYPSIKEHDNNTYGLMNNQELADSLNSYTFELCKLVGKKMLKNDPWLISLLKETARRLENL